MHSSHINLMRSIFTWCIVSVATIAAVAQSPHSDHGAPVKENWKAAVADADKNEVSGQDLAIRNARSALFDDKTGQRKPLDSKEPKDLTKGWSNNPPYWVHISPMPIQESDTIAIGKVVSFQPYLSNDHTHIYTELTIEIEKVIKDTTRRAGAGKTISILKGGGNLRLADGTIVRDSFAPANERLELDARYVLFLRYYPDFDYQVVKTWELENNHVIPTDIADISDANRGKSPYSKMTEAEFLEALDGFIASGQNPKFVIR